MWTIRAGLLVVATTATVAQLFEPPKKISNPCDSTKQLLHLKEQLLAKATTNGAQIQAALLKVAQLQAAAAAATGDEALMYAALAAGTGAKVSQAIEQSTDGVRRLASAAAASAQELAGVQTLLTDVAALSIKPMAAKQLSVSGPANGKHYIRFASTGATYTTCEPQESTPDNRQPDQNPDPANNVLDIFFLKGRGKAGPDATTALLCFHNTNTAACTAASANQNTYGELTTGKPLDLTKAQAKTPISGTQKFTITGGGTSNLLPPQKYVEARLATLAEGISAYAEMSFVADNLETPEMAVATEARLALLKALDPTEDVSKLSDKATEIDGQITKLYGKNGGEVKTRVWEKFKSIQIPKEATLDNKPTTLNKLDDLNKLWFVASFHKAKPIQETVARVHQKETEKNKNSGLNRKTRRKERRG
ncbi:variant surface glycoprotein [Trypanosoma brucei equiperdum]|uniref:Variant surface glycoprotein n=1 Tax=Trypanosoma brucei equiperdum TaxID=630700 RepID=A0A3L6L9Z2_9TRYP|nr:variant surface glycoprotein [Trypanosoma brucei equiperdum]